MLDGNLSNWPDSTRLPSWALGSTAGPANADIRMAWSEKGLYVAAQVSHTKVSVPDPKSFWDGDCLEVFVDTRNKKGAHKFEPGDHQFWIVPQVEQKKAYLGQWKRQSEIPQTLYDIPGTQSFSARTNDGYIIEMLIPAAQLQQYQPKAGSWIGLNLNLHVIGPKGNREVFWVLPKADGAPDQPANWGSLLLTE